MSILVANQLSRNYGGRKGIERVDLTVAEGEIFGFLGPNGAGKTTTIRILFGLLRPSSGTAHIFDRDCWRESAHIKRDVGYLPGDLRLYSWLTGRQALTIASEVRGSDLRPHGRDLLERFRLDAEVPVRKMSRGMRQKLGIVLALAHRPRLLILDEPTSALDPLMCAELYQCLREMAGRGTTVFFSSHTLSEVELLCQRVAIVRAGCIVADESIESLRSRALRAVELRFVDDAAALATAVPEFLDVTERSESVWKAELTAPTPQLIAWAAKQPLADLAVSPPSLESLFRRYYQKETEP